MLYQIMNGSVSFADQTILKNINFEIRNHEKIAVVGRNGCGKTTFLKLVSGELELDSGKDDKNSYIVKSGKPEIGYLRQISFEDTTLTMEQEIRKVFAPIEKMKQELEERAKQLEVDYSEEAVNQYAKLQEHFTFIGGYFYEKEYEVMIQKFGFNQEDKKKHLSEFSGGQQTKIAFIKLLLSKPDILLLDEPTNHLDIDAIEWLEGYIKSYPQAVVLVSHDRMFLDRIVDVVYEIEYHTMKRYPGNYTNFMVQKQANYEKQLKDYIAQQKEIERLQTIVEKYKNTPTKVAMTRSKLKAIEHMVKVEKPERFDTKSFHAQFQPTVITGNDVLSVQNLEIGYDYVLSSVTLEIKRGEKLGILGGNGLGKSTFLKTIVGNLDALGGSYRYGVNVQIGYFDQQMAQYQSEKTVLDDVWDEFPNLTQTEVRNMLGAFLFSGDDVFKTVDMLSGGEKVRLALCKILKKRPNVLILDEPTNHMDIVGKETLESMLQAYTGTLVFVSHDRYFVNKVSTRLLVFEQGKTKEYPYGFEQYTEEMQKSLESNTTGTKSKESTMVSKESYQLGKEQARKERQLKKIEENLEQLEEKLEELKMQLLNPEYQSDYVKLGEINDEIQQTEEAILVAMDEWETLSMEL